MEKIRDMNNDFVNLIQNRLRVVQFHLWLTIILHSQTTTAIFVKNKVKIRFITNLYRSP